MTRTFLGVGFVALILMGAAIIYYRLDYPNVMFLAQHDLRAGDVVGPEELKLKADGLLKIKNPVSKGDGVRASDLEDVGSYPSRLAGAPYPVLLTKLDKKSAELKSGTSVTLCPGEIEAVARSLSCDRGLGRCVLIAEIDKAVVNQHEIDEGKIFTLAKNGNC